MVQQIGNLNAVPKKVNDMVSICSLPHPGMHTCNVSVAVLLLTGLRICFFFHKDASCNGQGLIVVPN